ncbi:MAG TPA: glycoside hydrolase family 65, partial [Blastocatellia bacterium]|nr:glycoside hydrolase family 65 [Blastocatellia bacterium]
MTKLSRRSFIGTLAASGAFSQSSHSIAASSSQTNKINRSALVKRHNPTIRKLDPLASLSVGNGEFAFTADITGLQTFPSEYEKEMPLCTMAQWGWHSVPVPSGLDPKAFKLTQFDTYGRQVGYPISNEGQKELYNWLRENPHKLHLGQIGLKLIDANGQEAKASDITNIKQELDLWTGVLTSRFRFEEVPVTVRTAVHPELDLLAVVIESSLIAQGRLSVRIAFPYGSPAMNAADWSKPNVHQSKVVSQASNNALIQRTLDADQYFVKFAWDKPASFTTEKPHTFNLSASKGSSKIEFTAAFSPKAFKQALPSTTATFGQNAKYWPAFWNNGAAVELADSRDERAAELERRVILSQYLTTIQCSGSLPPQETGLTVNSWYGKFHLEMHWWHAAHFALWNRLPMLEKSLSYYDHILPSARQWAESQGYTGARWPKMTAPDGRDSPSPIGPLLIWQQPHPIFYAELCYLNHPNKQTLKRFESIVFESAEFMASFAHFDQKTDRFVLGPPVIPAQENHPPRETWNPTYELSYWIFGLKTAQRWRKRLGLAQNPKWDNVLNKLSKLPVQDGVYLAHENCPQTFTERNIDHPSMLGALGMLPGDGVDRETMRRTLHKVMKEWQWSETWGWDFPLTAMTAARLGETKIAVDALLMNAAKNRYLPNGHNYQRANLPCYLPGNGGLLYAIAMMAAGWQGAPNKHAPGFPDDGS